MAKQTVNLGTSANKGDGDPLRTAFDKVNDNFTEVYSLLGAEGGDVDDVVAPMLVHSDHTNVTVTRDDAANKIIFSVDPYDGDITGSVFADDSTLLVDGVNSNIPKANIEDSANWDTAFAWGNHASAGYQSATSPFTGDLTGSVFADDSTLLVDGVAGKVLGDVENNSVITGRVKSQDDIDLYVFAGGNGAVILAGQSDVSIGHTIGQVDIYGAVEFNNGTTSFQSGNDVTFNCPVNFTNSTITMPQYISLADLKTEVAASTDFDDFQARIAAL